MRISLLLLSLLWLGVPRPFAQSLTVPPEIELTLDMSSIDRLEPVLLTITLTNPSGEPQGYDLPSLWDMSRTASLARTARSWISTPSITSR